MPKCTELLGPIQRKCKTLADAYVENASYTGLSEELRLFCAYLHYMTSAADIHDCIYKHQGYASMLCNTDLIDADDKSYYYSHISGHKYKFLVCNNCGKPYKKHDGTCLLCD